MYKAVQMDRHT